MLFIIIIIVYKIVISDYLCYLCYLDNDYGDNEKHDDQDGMRKRRRRMRMMMMMMLIMMMMIVIVILASWAVQVSFFQSSTGTTQNHHGKGGLLSRLQMWSGHEPQGA